MVKVRFASVNMSDKAAKESRVKISLWGSTYQLVGQSLWFNDVVRFIKAPEGVRSFLVFVQKPVPSVLSISRHLSRWCQVKGPWCPFIWKTYQ